MSEPVGYTDGPSSAGLNVRLLRPNEGDGRLRRVEYVYRAYGDLLEFHHDLGHAMDRIADGEALLREVGHEEWANELRDGYLPSGAIDDRWTCELVGEFSDGFLAEITSFEGDVRDDLADGLDHVTEREQQLEWRERAEGWSPD